MDDIELTEQLREESNFKFTPILIMSSHTNASERKRGKAVGASGWIVKPFRSTQLIKTMVPNINYWKFYSVKRLAPILTVMKGKDRL
jgi:CheY-like chemotaxis protein